MWEVRLPPDAPGQEPRSEIECFVRTDRELLMIDMDMTTRECLDERGSAYLLNGNWSLRRIPEDESATISEIEETTGWSRQRIAKAIEQLTGKPLKNTPYEHFCKSDWQGVSPNHPRFLATLGGHTLLMIHESCRSSSFIHHGEWKAGSHDTQPCTVNDVEIATGWSEEKIHEGIEQLRLLAREKSKQV